MIDLQEIWCYDIEVYKNLFTASFGTLSGERAVFEISSRRNDHSALLDFIQNKTVAGYNNHGYDDLIVNELFRIPLAVKNPTRFLYNLSGQIIRNELDWRYKYENPTTEYRSIDLMTLHAFHKSGIGLKQIGISLLHPKVQDLPIAFDLPVNEDEIDNILLYNANDLDITLKLLQYSKSDLELRQQISDDYGVNVMSADRSKIANVVLQYYYAEYTGQQPQEFKPLRTYRDSIALQDIISSKISFESEVLKTFQNDLMSQTLMAIDGKFSFKRRLQYNNTTYDIGVGGLHSKDEGAVIVADDEYCLIDADVSSFYPMIMLLEKIIPAHLKAEFLRVLEDLTKERLAAKKAKKKHKADVMKITINSIFGKLGSEYHYLLDKSALFKVTVNGQLFLLMLVEALEAAGFEVISANTDGVTAKVKRTDIDRYNAVCQQWESNTGFSLEYAHYSKIIRRDVNNYLAIIDTDLVTKDGKIDILACCKAGSIKTKGIFEQEINLYKGYKHPVVSNAVAEYFVNGTPVADTIESCTDIYKFLLSQKTGREFVTRVYDLYGNSVRDLQKNNRYYVSWAGENILKIRKDGTRKISLVKGELLTLANDVTDRSNVANVKKEWYIGEAEKVVEAIQPARVLEQLLLF